MFSTTDDDIIDPFTDGPIKMPVKRLLTRHRRFIAPGASWEIFGGVEYVTLTNDFRYNVRFTYNMDYLFGGTATYAARIAANNAARNASVYTYNQTLTLLNLAAQAQAAGATAGRGKRSATNQGHAENL